LHTDAFETILSGNNLLANNLHHELVSSFYFNTKAIYHLFVTRQKPNKMYHCEFPFQIHLWETKKKTHFLFTKKGYKHDSKMNKQNFRKKLHKT
jgi:hypothetical protein